MDTSEWESDGCEDADESKDTDDVPGNDAEGDVSEDSDREGSGRTLRFAGAGGSQESSPERAPRVAEFAAKRQAHYRMGDLMRRTKFNADGSDDESSEGGRSDPEEDLGDGGGSVKPSDISNGRSLDDEEEEEDADDAEMEVQIVDPEAELSSNTRDLSLGSPPKRLRR